MYLHLTGYADPEQSPNRGDEQELYPTDDHWVFSYAPRQRYWTQYTEKKVTAHKGRFLVSTGEEFSFTDDIKSVDWDNEPVVFYWDVASQLFVQQYDADETSVERILIAE